MDTSRGMDPIVAELVIAEWQRRGGKRQRKEAVRSSVLDYLFDQQRDYLLDPARSKAVICERRAGKTVGLTHDLIDTASQHAGDDCLYLNPTAKQAHALMWEGPDGVKEACKRLGIRAHVNNQIMILRLPNGSRIYVGGAEKREDIEQYRGRKFKKIMIDEAGSFRPHLESLVHDVLQPTLMDLAGTLVLAGTPPKILAGLFYQAIRPDEERNTAYKLFRWSIFDNPHMKDPAGFHQWVLDTNGWTRENPTFRREYLGECVREDATLVYRHYDPARNGYDGLPPGYNDWMHILAVDLGYEDRTVLRVVSFSPSLPTSFLGRVHAEQHMTLTRMAEIAQAWDAEYGFVTKVADFGGGGKQIVAEVNERFGLNFEPADKRAKLSYIDAFNDDMLSGRIKVRSDDPVLDEWAKLQWNEIERLRGGERVTVKIEDPRIPNDISDATLYGWREAKHFNHVPVERTPRPGDADFPDYEAEQMLERAQAMFGEGAASDWSERGYAPEEGWAG